MKHSLLPRTGALFLSLCILCAPGACALTVQQAGELLKTYYVDEVPDSVLEQPTIDAMLESLGDPYTQYLTPQEHTEFLSDLSDVSLVGIGVVCSAVQDGAKIDKVLANSPAEKAGLQARDLITRIDGQLLAGLSTQEITALIQGEEGSRLALSYRRLGRENTVFIQRAVVIVPATTGELRNGHIGYINCTTFGDETLGHFQALIDEMKEQATVWVVDLRSNTGGLTYAATEAAGLFTGAGTMVYLRDNAGEYTSFSHDADSATIYPVIVLVGPYTASSSEVFAAAIRDYGAGVVVGERTFGKGVAQNLLNESTLPQYFSNGDAMKITSYRFFSPSGNTTDQLGVIPDLLVEPEYVEDVAYLLAAKQPTSGTGGFARLDMAWQWYIDLKTAKSAEYRDAFQALLHAIPYGKKVWTGVAGSSRWVASSAETIAQAAGVTYEPPVFPDQRQSDFYIPLSVLKTYGLVQGQKDGLYHPDDPLTWAQLCQLLAGVLNCKTPSYSSPFPDVPDGAWYAGAVTALHKLGLVTGGNDGLFHPEELVDHQQLIVILARLAQRLNMAFFDTAANMPQDAKEIVEVMHYDDWAKSSVWLFSCGMHNYAGDTIFLLWDEPFHIEPHAPATRDEAAYLLYEILSRTGILPA